MGLLDRNSRVVDAILTPEGRRQLSSGGLDVSFYAFEDAGVVYDREDSFVLRDPTNFLATEATSCLQDTLVPASNEAGDLLATISGSVVVSGGRAFLSTDLSEITQLDHDEAELSVDPTRALEFLSFVQTVDEFEDSEFEIAPNRLQFKITDDMPLDVKQQTGDIDAADPLYADPLLSHIINFAFLPPINAAGERLGQYQPIGSLERITTEKHLADLGAAEKKTIYMEPRPLDNKLAMQMFCFDGSKIFKLHAVDAGTARDSRVIFFGRVVKNSQGALVFMRLFTVTLDK